MKLSAQSRALLLGLRFYLPVALALGLTMNALGHLLCLAYFKYWWQVVTCYWGYVVPIALLLRRRSTVDQLGWGTLAMIPLELAGYGLGTSLPCPGNAIEAILGIRNFSLAMVVICGVIPWVVNALVGLIARYRWSRHGASGMGAIHPEIEKISGLIPPEVDARAEYYEHSVRKHR
ncbi:MAG TPA: hypothetical protein VN851_00240 [Thermoanaerobaculia bacterium]|nr:hypothetical protein [Thermoanaerobaculia bacterium]